MSVSGGTGGYEILWNTGDSEFELAGLEIGTYSATITDDNNCEIVIAVDVEDQIVAVNNVEETGWEVYPNPANNFVFLEFDENLANIDNVVQIYTSSGQLLKELTLPRLNSSPIKLELDYPAGMYVILLKNERFTSIEKVVLAY